VPDAEPLQSMAVYVLGHASKQKEQVSCRYFEYPGTDSRQDWLVPQVACGASIRTPALRDLGALRR
jgi:hypothetical protein